MAISLTVERLSLEVESAARELEAEICRQMIETAEKILELMHDAFQNLNLQLNTFVHEVNTLGRRLADGGNNYCQEWSMYDPVHRAVLGNTGLKLDAINRALDQLERSLR